MANNFWFKFEWQKWTTDKSLRRCTLETRGFWIECLCVMYELDEVFIEGTPAEIANLVGSDARTVKRCIDNLHEKNAAQVVKNGQFVKITSRRLLKAVNLREYNKLKKREERSRGGVNDQSKDSSKDQSLRDSEKKESPNGDEKETPLLEIFLGETSAGLSKRMGVKTLPNERDWFQRLDWAFKENYTSAAVLECYDLLKADPFWANKSLSAKTLMDNVPNLANLRKTSKSSIGKIEKLPTAAERLADAAANDAAMRPPPTKIMEGIH